MFMMEVQNTLNFIHKIYCIYKMNNIQKRFVLFLVGCIGIRTLLVYVAKKATPEYLQYMGYIAIIPAISFLFLYITNSRRTGAEVFGRKIWWNDLRPVHSLLYGLFAFSAINKKKSSWIYLLVDVIIGLLSFVTHHYNANSVLLL